MYLIIRYIDEDFVRVYGRTTNSSYVPEDSKGFFSPQENPINTYFNRFTLIINSTLIEEALSFTPSASIPDGIQLVTPEKLTLIKATLSPSIRKRSQEF